MNKTTISKIIHHKFTGDGTDTGYILYIDEFTHNTCIDVYRAGKCIERHQTNDDEMEKGILEEVKLMGVV